MIDDTVVLPYQQRYVKRIVDEVLSPGHDHVLFQIGNESGIGDASLEPDPYWASFVRKYAESTYRRTVYVCTSRRFHRPTPFWVEKLHTNGTLVDAGRDLTIRRSNLLTHRWDHWDNNRRVTASFKDIEIR